MVDLSPHEIFSLRPYIERVKSSGSFHIYTCSNGLVIGGIERTTNPMQAMEALTKYFSFFFALSRPLNPIARAGIKGMSTRNIFFNESGESVLEIELHRTSHRFDVVFDNTKSIRTERYSFLLEDAIYMIDNYC